MDSSGFPPFEPHPLVRGGHAQTLLGAYLPGPRISYRARQHQVTLADGDRLVLHDDCPLAWQPGDRTALMIHGLAGCHRSGYMQRIAARLHDRGVRAFRLDLRGCGAGTGLARLPYHSGRSEDAAAALTFIAAQCPRSPTTLVGFSLGGNIALKLLGEVGDNPCGNLDSGIAVCPPVDLAVCAERLQQSWNRFYDRHFVALLLRQLEAHREMLPGVNLAELQRPKRLFEFDDRVTAPASGFASAAEYYRLCSSNQYVPSIRLPTLILASCDDPMIPAHVIETLALAPSVALQLAEHGGHLGFISRRGAGSDCRWMDWRVVEWVAGRRNGKSRL